MRVQIWSFLLQLPDMEYSLKQIRADRILSTSKGCRHSLPEKDMSLHPVSVTSRIISKDRTACFTGTTTSSTCWKQGSYDQKNNLIFSVTGSRELLYQQSRLFLCDKESSAARACTGRHLTPRYSERTKVSELTLIARFIVYRCLPVPEVPFSA